jgi:hypothetical protein
LTDKKETFHFMAPFLAMAKLKQAWLCSSGLTKTFVFHGTFSRHGIAQASLALLIWLNENVPIWERSTT